MKLNGKSRFMEVEIAALKRGMSGIDVYYPARQKGMLRAY